jgi:hypothetical protein
VNKQTASIDPQSASIPPVSINEVAEGDGQIPRTQVNLAMTHSRRHTAVVKSPSASSRVASVRSDFDRLTTELQV